MWGVEIESFTKFILNEKHPLLSVGIFVFLITDNFYLYNATSV